MFPATKKIAHCKMLVRVNAFKELRALCALKYCAANLFVLFIIHFISCVRFKWILIWKIRYVVLVTQTQVLISVVNCHVLNTTVVHVGNGIILSKDYVTTNPRLAPVKPRQVRRLACLDFDSVCR